MTSTKERIEADIKKNLAGRIEELVSEESFIRGQMHDEIAEQAMDMAGKLTNLSSAGTKAGDKEVLLAVDLISQRIAKALIAYLKEEYKLK